MAIRYDKKLNQEINRVIRNFNQKIARLEKEKREFLPSKVKVSSIKKQYRTRQELNRKLKELQRFSLRGSENIININGTQLTQYQYKNLRKIQQRNKMILNSKIKKYEETDVKVFGTRQGVTFAQIGDRVYLNIKAQREALNKDIKKLNKEDLERFINYLNKLEKNRLYLDEQFKTNYLDVLTRLGYYVGYDNTKLNYIKEQLMKLNTNNFIKLFNEDKAIKDILEYYPEFLKSFRRNFNVARSIEKMSEDVSKLYDNLYNNIGYVLRDYK